jgi:mycofactocin glycosyltransferase
MVEASQRNYVIPLVYRLRDRVRVHKRPDHALVVCGIPLSVVRVTLRAAHILALCDGVRSVSEIGKIVGAAEKPVIDICEYFNRKGVLETVIAENSGYFPSISVIVPVKDRRDDIGPCLESVLQQDYPHDLVEVIVVDDGSSDETARLASSFSCRVISLRENHGQSYCRNLAAQQAKGDILAFLDSDCVASATWLRDLVTYFQWEQVGIVGGRVNGFYEESALDRYEMAFSSLNMGKYLIHGKNDENQAYVPTCNLLVRRNVYRDVGGIRQDMTVGEDVDLCWRVRKFGHDLLYVPSGEVAHKHRSSLQRMLLRRADYGTSEGLLHKFHPDKKKTFQLRLLPLLTLASILTALAILSSIPLLFPVIAVISESYGKTMKIRRLNVTVSYGTVLFSVCRAHLSLHYFVTFHIVRYYFLVLAVIAFFVSPIILPLLFLVGLSSAVDYTVKHPRLDYVRFLFFYVLEHIFYQIGVFIGCLRLKTFRSYIPYVRRKRVMR